MAMTSDNTALLASICLWVYSREANTANFPEYHTSADNLDFIKPHHLAESFQLIMSVIDVLENDRFMLNTNPKCEPALGRRGLYSTVGGDKEGPVHEMAMLWLLNFSDGEHSLLDIAERSGTHFP